MTNHDTSSLLALLLSFGFVALLWAGTEYLVERRKIKLEEMADRLGMTIPKSRRRGMPGDLSFSGTKFNSWTKLHSIHASEWNGCTVAFFDCQMGSGRGMRIKTIVAVRSEGEVTGLEELGMRLKTQRVGHWVLIYQHWNLNPTGYRYLRTAELERLMVCIRDGLGGVHQ